MADKYCEWNMAGAYLRTDMVGEKFFEKEKDKILKPYSFQIINCDSSKSKVDYTWTLLDLHKMEIVARIACSRGITLFQLVAFLRLQGYDTTDNAVKEHLFWLMEKEIIRKVTINTHVNNIIFNEENLEFYWLGRRGWDIAKALGVPVPTKNQTSNMFCNYGKKRYILSIILWNQIIINQLLHNPNTLHFKIHTTVNFKNGESFHIPLLLRTKEQDYIFEYAKGKYIKPAYVEKVVEQWKKYQKNTKKKNYLIFVCEDEVSIRRVRQIVGETNNGIFFTEDKMWWENERGKIFKWKEMDGRSVIICIDKL